MKRALLIASIVAVAINGESMKLVEKETGHIVVEFTEGTVKFYSRFLEKVFKEEGIFIPPVMRSQFNGKEVVFMGDSLFEKAFIEVEWPINMAGAGDYSKYEWQK